MAVIISSDKRLVKGSGFLFEHIGNQVFRITRRKGKKFESVEIDIGELLGDYAIVFLGKLFKERAK